MTMFENFGRKIDGYTQIDIYVEDPVSIQNVYDKVKNLSESRQYIVIISPTDSLL